MTFEFSAGGIVVRHEKHEKNITKNTKGNDVKILLCQHSQHHGWVFPKGLIGDHEKGETKEATALREVKEETGVKGKIIQPLSPVTYWYQWQGEKKRKTVYYYLMDFIGGDITKHDFEMENVQWLPIDAVDGRLTYASDKKVWKEAKRLIESGEVA